MRQNSFAKSLAPSRGRDWQYRANRILSRSRKTRKTRGFRHGRSRSHFLKSAAISARSVPPSISDITKPPRHGGFVPDSDVIARALSNRQFSLQVRVLPLPVRGMRALREGEASLWPTRRRCVLQTQRRPVAAV